MNTVWNRLHNWLNANTPTGYGNLRRGADFTAIEATESIIGLKFPDHFKAFYVIHDGQDDGPGIIGGEGWQLLPLHEIVSLWARWDKSNPKYACFVPIAVNVMSDYVLLDLNANANYNGRIMVQRHDCLGPDLLAPTISAWIADFVDQLEEGLFAYSRDERMVMYADELESE